VALLAVAACGCIGEESGEEDQNQSPSSNLTSDVWIGEIPLEVTFQPSCSDSDGSIESWMFDADNDGISESSGNGTPPSELVFIYENVGEYTASILITDNDGGNDTSLITINAVSGPDSYDRTGSFNTVDRISDDSYRFYLSLVFPLTYYGWCQAVLVTPDSVMSSINFDHGVNNYYVKEDIEWLTWINITDLGNDGTISTGDYLTIWHEGPLYPGSWSIYLVFLGNGQRIANETFLVDQDTPTGAFASSDNLSYHEYSITFSSFDPMTYFQWCWLRIDSPNGYMNLYPEYDKGTYYTFNESLGFDWVKIFDLAEDNDIDSGDYILIHNDEPLLNGEWTITLIYSYNGAVIAFTEFTI